MVAWQVKSLVSGFSLTLSGLMMASVLLCAYCFFSVRQ